MHLEIDVGELTLARGAGQLKGKVKSARFTRKVNGNLHDPKLGQQLDRTVTAERLCQPAPTVQSIRE